MSVWLYCWRGFNFFDQADLAAIFWIIKFQEPHSAVQ